MPRVVFRRRSGTRLDAGGTKQAMVGAPACHRRGIHAPYRLRLHVSPSATEPLAEGAGAHRAHLQPAQHHAALDGLGGARGGRSEARGDRRAQPERPAGIARIRRDVAADAAHVAAVQRPAAVLQPCRDRAVLPPRRNAEPSRGGFRRDRRAGAGPRHPPVDASRPVLRAGVGQAAGGGEQPGGIRVPRRHDPHDGLWPALSGLQVQPAYRRAARRRGRACRVVAPVDRGAPVHHLRE